MKVIRRIFDFYLNASIHVALAVVSLISATDLILNNSLNYQLNIFAFCASIATYNFIKYGVEARKYLIVASRYQQIIQIFSFFNIPVALYFAFALRLNSILLLGFTGLLIGVYALPIFPGLRNLRNFGILKVVIVSLVWTFITSLLPMMEEEIILKWDHYISLIQRFLFILILMIPFEIRDLKYDPSELKTIPQQLGVYKTKVLGVGLIIILFLLTFLKDELVGGEILARSLLVLLLVYILTQTRERQSYYFASFWVEAVPILWFILVFAITTFA